jgi:hypothetical protein
MSNPPADPPMDPLRLLGEQIEQFRRAMTPVLQSELFRPLLGPFQQQVELFQQSLEAQTQWQGTVVRQLIEPLRKQGEFLTEAADQLQEQAELFSRTAQLLIRQSELFRSAAAPARQQAEWLERFLKPLA